MSLTQLYPHYLAELLQARIIALFLLCAEEQVALIKRGKL